MRTLIKILFSVTVLFAQNRSSPLRFRGRQNLVTKYVFKVLPEEAAVAQLIASVP
jgi:hypothetical protein